MASSSRVRAGIPGTFPSIDAIDFTDLETSKLIAQLALEDISRVDGGRKGKARYGTPPSDEEIAFRTQCEYWQNILQAIDDHLLAQSINTALESDEAHINVLSTIEQAAADDRAAAEALSRGLPLPTPSRAQRSIERKEFTAPLVDKPGSTSPSGNNAGPSLPSNPSSSARITATPHQSRSRTASPKLSSLSRIYASLPKLSSLSRIYAARPQSVPAVAESSRQGTGAIPPATASTKPSIKPTNPRLSRTGSSRFSSEQEKSIQEVIDSPRVSSSEPFSFLKGKEPAISTIRQTRFSCVICGELICGSRLHNNCNHDYCGDCVVSLIEACTKDETLYPPRCCHQPFRYEDIINILSHQLRATFDRKRVELDVPAENRVYCPTSACSRFLGSRAGVKRDFTCPDCSIRVCAQCRQPAHPGDSCSENVATEAVRELARNERWQTCPQCKTIIELNQGCYHITCRCRTQFCYLCAETWKNCTCSRWDENRINDTAQRRVQQEVGPTVQVNQPAFQERVNALVNVLRDHHDCYNHRWKSRGGPAQCEECYDVMPIFIMVCQTCHLRACKRCARNRL